jgi:hypothetical protein
MSFIPIDRSEELKKKLAFFFETPAVGFLEPHGYKQREHRGSFVKKAPLFDQGLRKLPWARSVEIFRLMESSGHKPEHPMG